MEIGLIIKNLIFAAIIGGLAFASQIPASRPVAQDFYAKSIKGQNASYLAKADDWLKTTIYPRLGWVSGEVAKTQDSVQQNITDKKNNLVETSTHEIKKLVAKNIINYLGISAQELGGCKAPD